SSSTQPSTSSGSGFFAAAFLAFGLAFALAGLAFVSAAGFSALAFFAGAAVSFAIRDQRLRLFQRDAVRVLILRNGGVGRSIGDVGPIAALHHLDDGFAIGTLAQLFQCFRRATRTSLRLFFGKDRDGAVDAQREHFVRIVERGVSAVMRHVRPEAAEVG